MVLLCSKEIEVQKVGQRSVPQCLLMVRSMLRESVK